MPKRSTEPASSSSSSKRLKTNTAKPGNVADTVNDVVRLEKQVEDALSASTSLNPLADLLQISSKPEADLQVVLKAIFAIYRLLVQIIRKTLLNTPENSDADLDEAQKKRAVIRAWISTKLDTYTTLLCGLLKDEEKELRTASLKILLSLLRESSASQKTFDIKHWKKVVFASLTCPPSHRSSQTNATSAIELDVREQFCDDWLNVNVDLRWYFLRETAVLLKDQKVLDKHPCIIANAVSILEKVRNIPKPGGKSVLDGLEGNSFFVECLAAKPKRRKEADVEEEEEDEDEPANQKPAEDEDDWRAFFDDDPKPSAVSSGSGHRPRRVHAMNVHEQLHSPQAHRAVFTKCWLTLLPLLSAPRGFDDDPALQNVSVDALVTRVLDVMHHSVLPNLTRPILVMDWIAGCVDHGGIVGLLALNGLFVLFTEYNLDYPRFYSKLYSFLDRDVLHFKYQARFFRLLERFLSSSHLPLTLLASFLKRLARLSLSASPAAILPIIPFTYNLLKRHPALMVLIHRVADEGAASDPFRPSEEDPTQTGAFESSLWELMSHTSHYHPVVATLARIFSEAFTKPGYNLEDFLDHTYGTLFTTEAKRPVKLAPALQIANISKPTLLEEDELKPVLQGMLFC